MFVDIIDDDVNFIIDQTALKDQTKPEATKEQSTTDNASDAFKNPVAAAVVSDTGEVPSNLTKKLGWFRKITVVLMRN